MLWTAVHQSMGILFVLPKAPVVLQQSILRNDKNSHFHFILTKYMWPTGVVISCFSRWFLLVLQLKWHSSLYDGLLLFHGLLRFCLSSIFLQLNTCWTVYLFVSSERYFHLPSSIGLFVRAPIKSSHVISWMLRIFEI